MAIYRRPRLLDLVNKIKPWPSKSGLLHGVREVKNPGSLLRINTHCGRTIIARESRRGRPARWLRNYWTKMMCPDCKIPDWKIERFKKGAVKKCREDPSTRSALVSRQIRNSV